MHPTLYPAPFTAAGWVFENKFDGFHALVRKSGDKLGLISRRGRSFARAFPEVVGAIAMLPRDAVLDAELVVSDERGHPSFERLRRRSVMTRPMRIADAAGVEPAILCVFDLLSIDGEDLRPLPLLDRKRRLVDLLPATPRLHLVTHLEEHGEAVYAHAVELGLEDVVAKRADSPYRAGRQPSWRKIKNPDFYRKEALGFGNQTKG
jgi:bifunctional non-homologous end joining protein LigD